MLTVPGPAAPPPPVAGLAAPAPDSALAFGAVTGAGFAAPEPPVGAGAGFTTPAPPVEGATSGFVPLALPVPPVAVGPPPRFPVAATGPVAAPPGAPGRGPSGEIVIRAERFPSGTFGGGAGGAGVVESAIKFRVSVSFAAGPRSGAAFSLVDCLRLCRGVAFGFVGIFSSTFSALFGLMFSCCGWTFFSALISGAGTGSAFACGTTCGVALVGTGSLGCRFTIGLGAIVSGTFWSLAIVGTGGGAGFAADFGRRGAALGFGARNWTLGDFVPAHSTMFGSCGASFGGSGDDCGRISVWRGCVTC